MNDFDKKLEQFKNKAKDFSANQPLQEVKPKVNTPALKEPEVQLNVLIPKSLLVQLKRNAIEKDITLKDLVIELLNKD